MAVRGLSFAESEAYVLRSDPDWDADAEVAVSKGATGFYHKPLPSGIQAMLQDMQQTAKISFAEGNSQTINNRQAARNREAFKYAVTGWKNFFDQNDAPIPYASTSVFEGGRTYSVVADAALDAVPLFIINEVGDYIFRKNTLSEDALKKYEELSSLFGGSATSDVEIAPKNSEDGEGATITPPKDTTGGTPSLTTKRKVTKGKTDAPAVLS